MVPVCPPRQADRPPCRSPADIGPAWGFPAPGNSPSRRADPRPPTLHRCTDQAHGDHPHPSMEKPARTSGARARVGTVTAKMGAPRSAQRGIRRARTANRQGREARRASHSVVGGGICPPAPVNPIPAPSRTGGQVGAPAGRDRGRKTRTPRSRATIVRAILGAVGVATHGQCPCANARCANNKVDQ